MNYQTRWKQASDLRSRWVFWAERLPGLEDYFVADAGGVNVPVDRRMSLADSRLTE